MAVSLPCLDFWPFAPLTYVPSDTLNNVVNFHFIFETGIVAGRVSLQLATRPRVAKLLISQLRTYLSLQRHTTEANIQQLTYGEVAEGAEKLLEMINKMAKAVS